MPSHGTIAAYLALFISLGGVSYAAATLPNNSVGSEQIVKDGVLKPDIGPDAVGTTEIKPDGVRSGDVKDFTLRCEDFKPAEEACGVPGPRGPIGPPGPPGADATDETDALTTTTVRMHEEVIELTCGAPDPFMGGRSCTGSETVSASCEAGEVATGGSVPTPAPTGQTTTTVRNDRPNPSAGTPTGWTADVSSGGATFSSDPPPNQTVTVYAVCAS
jgi:hypothetical protein